MLVHYEQESQIEIMKERHHANPIDKVETVVDIPTLKKLIDEVTNIYVADEIYDYITELAEATRNNQHIQLGVSPRGALAVCRTAKAAAYINGRDYVTPADVRAVFTDVCAHRIVLSTKARLHEYTAELLFKDLLEDVKSPEVKESLI